MSGLDELMSPSVMAALDGGKQQSQQQNPNQTPLQIASATDVAAANNAPPPQQLSQAQQVQGTNTGNTSTATANSNGLDFYTPAASTSSPLATSSVVQPSTSLNSLGVMGS